MSTSCCPEKPSWSDKWDFSKFSYSPPGELPDLKPGWYWISLGTEYPEPRHLFVQKGIINGRHMIFGPPTWATLEERPCLYAVEMQLDPNPELHYPEGVIFYDPNIRKNNKS